MITPIEPFKEEEKRLVVVALLNSVVYVVSRISPYVNTTTFIQ